MTFLEICIFFEFSNSFSVMLGRGVGFLGSDTMSRLTIKWIENKFNTKQGEKMTYKITLQRKSEHKNIQKPTNL